MKTRFSAPLALASALALAAAGCGDVAIRPELPEAYKAPPRPGAPPPPEGGPLPGEIPLDPQVTAALVKMAEQRGAFKRDLAGSEDKPVGDVLLLGSPIGFQLRNRFLNLGIPLGEAFSRGHDPAFRTQLLELARWDRDGESRASALIALAQEHELKYLQALNEALIHLDPGVRFGALEALVAWRHPREAMPLLAAASERDTEPILRVYAAAGLARLGDAAGLHRLRAFVDDPSWLVRAMAAKYIGELGTAEDYELLLGRIDRESGNDFNVAEDCVSALKLWPLKKAANEADAAAASARRATPAPAPEVPQGDDMVLALEPLTITAPRVKQQEQIDPRIDQHLMRLLQQKLEARPTGAAQLDSSLFNLARLSTVTGYALKTRYTELGFLLTEGLAGTTDFQLQSELEKAARSAPSAQTRAAALVALAYTKDNRFLTLFQGALADPNITVRFAALESLLVMGDRSVEIQLSGAAHNDPSIAGQIYAAAGLWRMGNPFGREILLRFLDHQDWLPRAMSAYYLGELGGGYEYRKLQQLLDRETDLQAKAEIATALVKLNSKRDQP